MMQKQKRYGDGTAYFQKEFSDSEFLRFARVFGCDATEKFRCAILFSRVVPTGFLLTDKAIHFEDGTKISFTNESFQNENVNISSETFFNATFGVLKIEVGEFYKEYYFKNVNLDALEALKLFLKSVFDGNIVEDNDYSMTFKVVKGNGLINFCGLIIEKISSAINFVFKKINCLITNFHNKICKRKQPSHEIQKIENSSDIPIQVSKKYRPNLFVQTLDFIASILFITSFIFVFKPELFMDYKFIDNVENYKLLEYFGHWVLYFKLDIYELSMDSMILQVLAVLICLVSFIILKLIVIFSNRSRTQIFAFLMLLLTLTSTIFLKEKMSLLIVFVLLSYLIFELLIGQRISNAFKKIIALIIIGIVEYIVLNFTMNGITKSLSSQLFNSFAIRGLSWW